MDQWGMENASADPWGSRSAGESTWNDNNGGDVGPDYGQTNRTNGISQAAEFGGAGNETRDDKCFGCGEVGHMRADCQNSEEITCRYCKQAGHMVRDCPDKPPMLCENCGEEGHMRKNCENARKINRDHVADVAPEVCLQKIKQAVAERDANDAKEAVQEFIKANNGDITFRQLQTKMIEEKTGLWLIASERELINVFTNMDLQGNMGKKYSVSYRFSEKPERPREAEAWPKDQDELLDRLDDAGDVVDSGLPKCYNCGEVGHTSKFCPEEKLERADQVKVCCNNCGRDDHRQRDCREKRVDKFACKNCGQSGHKVAECPEPPNADNVECRKCNEIGHFAKDCPQGGGRECRNCGGEGHMAKECDQPRNMALVTCRNCEKTGHMSRDCPEPRDWSKVQCINCQEFGHTKVRCKQPLAESDQFPDSGDAGGFPASNGFPTAEATTFDDPLAYDGGGGGGW